MTVDKRRNIVIFFVIFVIVSIFLFSAYQFDEPAQFQAPKGAPYDHQQEKSSEKINCKLKTRLGRKHEFGIFPLVSLPGSGNT